MKSRNLTMLTDFYEMNMMYAHYLKGTHRTRAVFDLFFRENPCGGGYAITAGLESAVQYIENLNFDPDAISYLRSLGRYSEEFLEFLAGFQFTGDIDAIPEGTVVFPGEPLLRVTASIAEAQLVETALLTLINHQTLIATKASRVVRAAAGDPVIEFGLRRAQGPDSGLYGARAAIIGGCAATSNVLAGMAFGTRLGGTHGHSLVQFFDDEEAAFAAYADAFPGDTTLLVDTFDTLKLGLPNAIRTFERLRAKGHRPAGIRLDSGDLAYLSKEARRMLDEAGFPEVKVVASSDLDEYLIRDLKTQGARIDVWGVGTNLITSRDCPSLGGVYKMSAVDENGQMVPRIKISENPAKVTNPGLKKVVRLYSGATGKAVADLIQLADEELDQTKPLTIFDPVHTWKKKTLTCYTFRELLVPIFREGRLIYNLPPLDDIRAHAQRGLDTLWDEHKRLTNPAHYPVDLSQKLWDLRQEMIHRVRGSVEN